MKKTLVSVLQQRMDKCTSEQFWASSTLTAVNGFLILEKDQFLAVVPAWLILTALAIATGYGVFFIIHRHVAYFSIQNSLIDLLQGEKEIPEVFREKVSPWHISMLTGVTFYVSWIVALTSFNFLNMIKTP
jgi:hypothetical protein